MTKGFCDDMIKAQNFCGVTYEKNDFAMGMFLFDALHHGYDILFFLGKR